MQTFEASVTFEFETAKPLTAKVTVSADRWHTAAARAIVAAGKQLSPGHWSSLVCVLERPLAVPQPAPDGLAAANDEPEGERP